MGAEAYICTCGSKNFVKYVGDKTIYCKQCGKATPGNVKFKESGNLLESLSKENKEDS